MSGPCPKKLTGPLRYSWAVAMASLDRTAKLVLYGFSPHWNWDTWLANPSNEVLARNTGLRDRAVRSALARLRAAGVIVPHGHTGGGRTPSGRGITNAWWLDIDRLETLNPARDAGLSAVNPAANAAIPGAPCHPTRQGVPPNPAPDADKHTNEQTPQQNMKHTTTGGGGGARSLRSVGEEDRTAEEAEARSLKMLLAFRVSNRKARTLAQRFPPEVVEAGIEYVDTECSNVDSPPGMLVTVLEDGTAEEHARILHEEWLAREREIGVQALAKRIGELFSAVQAGLESDDLRVKYQQSVKFISKLWFTPVDIVRAGIVTEADFADPNAKPRVIFNKICDAAKRVRREQGNQEEKGVS